MTTTTYTMSAPAEFDGTAEQREANLDTHSFWAYDPDEVPRCDRCDARAYSTSSFWPCGSDVPRVVTSADGTVTVMSSREEMALLLASR